MCDFLKNFKWFVYQELSNAFGWGFNQISGCGKLPAGELGWHHLVVGISSVYQGLWFENLLMCWPVISRTRMRLAFLWGKLVAFFQSSLHSHSYFKNHQGLFLIVEPHFYLNVFLDIYLTWSLWALYWNACISVMLGHQSFNSNLGQHQVFNLAQNQSNFVILSSFAWFWLIFLLKTYEYINFKSDS